MLTATPVLMLAQIIALPVYLWLFAGTEEVLTVFSAGPFVEAFLLLIVLPLGLVIGTQYLKARRSAVGSLASRWDSVMGYLPVPFLALTLLAVVASQTPKLADTSGEDAFGQVLGVVPIYVAFLGIMALLGRLTARLFSLGVRDWQGAHLYWSNSQLAGGTAPGAGVARRLRSDACHRGNPDAGGARGDARIHPPRTGLDTARTSSP